MFTSAKGDVLKGDWVNGSYVVPDEKPCMEILQYLAEDFLSVGSLCQSIYDGSMEISEVVKSSFENKTLQEQLEVFKEKEKISGTSIYAHTHNIVSYRIAQLIPHAMPSRTIYPSQRPRKGTGN